MISNGMGHFEFQSPKSKVQNIPQVHFFTPAFDPHAVIAYITMFTPNLVLSSAKKRLLRKS
jgi:hypothetical protein